MEKNLVQVKQRSMFFFFQTAALLGKKVDKQQVYSGLLPHTKILNFGHWAFAWADFGNDGHKND